MELPLPDLTETHDPLARDVASVRRARTWLVERARFVDGRLLVLIPCGPGSQPLLGSSLPKLVADTHAIGLALDLVLGLNDDTAAPDVLSSLADVDVVHLRTENRGLEDLAAAFAADASGALGDEPRRVTLADVAGASGRSRVFVVHQTRSERSSGVLALMSELHALLLAGVDAGWPLPRRALRCDAESHFVELEPGCIPEWSRARRTNGLRLLLAVLDEPGPALACATNLFCRYPGAEAHAQPAVVPPDCAAPISAAHTCLNVLLGAPGFDVLSGSGFAGRSEDVLALGWVGYRAARAVQVDDVVLQHLARELGLVTRAPRACRVTNRTADPLDTQAVRHQLARWLATTRRARLHYGVSYLPVRGKERRNALRLLGEDARTDLRVGFKAARDFLSAARLARRARNWQSW